MVSFLTIRTKVLTYFVFWLAELGVIFKSTSMLKLDAGPLGDTLAHWYARHNINVPSVTWAWENRFGTRVAHCMASCGYRFDEKVHKKILALSDNFGWTVAHEMAKAGFVFMQLDTLKLHNKRGWTVAHEMSDRGNRFTHPEINELTDKFGVTVKEAFEKSLA